MEATIYKILLASVLSAALLFSSAAEARIVTDRFPIQMYVDHRMGTYNRAVDVRRTGLVDVNTDLIRAYSVRNDGEGVSSGQRRAHGEPLKKSTFGRN